MRALNRHAPLFLTSAIFAGATWSGSADAQPQPRRPPIVTPGTRQNLPTGPGAAPGGPGAGAGAPAGGGATGGGATGGGATGGGATGGGATGGGATGGGAPGGGTTPGAAPGGAPGGATPGAAPPAADGKPVLGPNGKAIPDTKGLAQFEQGIEYEPRPADYRVSFSLEDADLNELVRVIGELTGKRFIFGGKLRNFKATVFSPQKVTVAEAYQAFLSILEANGMTVVPHGKFLKIVDTGGAAAQATPLYNAGEPTPAEERYVTRVQRLKHINAEDASTVLSKFKTKDGDITVYGPGNLLIITDTGSNIRRMIELLEDIDVGGAGDQIWIEHVNYTSASDIATRLNDVFDIHGGGAGGASHTAAATTKPGEAGGVGGVMGAGAGDLHIAKIVADERSNSVIIISTERAYLRILEFIKRLDVPQHIGEGGDIHVMSLQHAEAEPLAKVLNEIITGANAAAAQGASSGAAAKPGATTPLTGVFESGIKVSADKATNSIVITSSLRDYASLRAVIDQLDQARRQVYIEAVIMDLTIDRQNSLGMAFHAGDVENSPIGTGQSIIYGGLNPFRSILLPSPTDSTLQAFALGVRGPGLPGSENLLGTGFSIPAFGILLDAVASTNDADILSTPHILATDNEDATISVGQNIALQQNAAPFGGLPGVAGAGAAGAAGALGGLGALGGGFGVAPRGDVGTKVKITPHINDSNEVRLKISEEISDVIGNQPQGTLGTIPFAKRTAETVLVVKDQQTVVIGGLVRSRVAHSQTKIPLLGDIPVLGALFRSNQDSLTKTNLVLIMTPYIIREQSDLRTIFERKMQERQEFLDHYFVFGDQNEYEPAHDYTRTNGLLEEVRQGYLEVEDRKKLEELTRPKEIRGHEPGQPLELPAPGSSGAAGHVSGPTAGEPATPPPGGIERTSGAPLQNNLNVTTPPRTVERTEH